MANSFRWCTAIVASFVATFPVDHGIGMAADGKKSFSTLLLGSITDSHIRSMLPYPVALKSINHQYLEWSSLSTATNSRRQDFLMVQRATGTVGGQVDHIRRKSKPPLLYQLSCTKVFLYPKVLLKLVVENYWLRAQSTGEGMVKKTCNLCLCQNKSPNFT